MTTTTELEPVEVEQRAPLTLFGTDDPAAVVERASKVATTLADVLKRRRLVKRLGSNEYVLLEGWTLLGSMLGVFAQVEWTRPIEDGWEARAVVRTMGGNAVGSAEAMCTHRENKWKTQDDYAVRSMSQTRAMAKALRMPLGFIVELAGYAATPAEEMPDNLPDIPAQEPRRHDGLTRAQLWTRIVERANEHDLPAEVLGEVVTRVFGGRTIDDLDADEMIQLGTDITSGKYDVPFEAPAADKQSDVEASATPAAAAGPTLDDILAATGGTLDEPEDEGSPAKGGGAVNPRRAAVRTQS